MTVKSWLIDYDQRLHIFSHKPIKKERELIIYGKKVGGKNYNGIGTGLLYAY